MKGYIFHEIDRFSLKLFCSSQWQNLLRVNARTEGYWQVSLRSWRICLGARLTFWRRSCDKKREWGRGVWISISRGLRRSRRLRRQILLDYYRIPPATQATGRWNFQIWCLSEAVVSTKHFPRGASHKSVFADVPENGLQTLRITLLKSDPYYSHLTTYYLMITWLVFELATDSR